MTNPRRCFIGKTLRYKTSYLLSCLGVSTSQQFFFRGHVESKGIGKLSNSC